MLSTKTYNNNSSIYANTAIFDKLEVDQAKINNYPSNSDLESTIQEVYSVISGNYYNRTESDTNYPTFGYLIDNNYDKNYINVIYYNKQEVD